MESSSQECEVCKERYDTAERKPIIVLCGHSFCRRCLLALERQGNMKCPKCRQTVTSPVGQLPVNYALTPSEANAATSKSCSKKFECCPSHGFDLDHFCVSCGVLICTKCVVQSHHQHSILAEKDLFKENEFKTEFELNLESRINMSFGFLSRAGREAEDIRDAVKKLEQCEEDVQQCQDTLESMRATVAEDARAWGNVDSKSAAEKLEMFKTLPRQWQYQNEVKTLCKDLVSEIVKSNVARIQETLMNLQASPSMDPSHN